VGTDPGWTPGAHQSRSITPSPSWSRLALALSDVGEASGSFSQKQPL